MKRRWFAVLGAIVVLLDGYFLLQAPSVPGSTMTVVLIGLGGLLLLAAGFDPVSDVMPWYRLVGVSVVLFGAVFLVVWVVPVLRGARSSTAFALAAAGLVNALVLGIVGVDWFRGGNYFDLTVYEPGPFFGGESEEE